MIKVSHLSQKLCRHTARYTTYLSALYGLLIVGGTLLACEEHEVASNVRQPLVNRSAVVSKPSNTIDLAKYRKAGNGPMKAPDWIASQDLSLMRRYSLNKPTGFRNGVEFSPKGIWVERREAGWVLVLNEEKLTYNTQLKLKGQRVEVPLEGQPNAQFQLQRTAEQSEAKWRIPSASIEGKTRQWDAKGDYSVEILQWSVKPYNPKGPVFQVAGKVSGRLMVQFIDDQGIQGWVVGKFENVMSRYMGDPTKW
jgi:hypothetical protein